MDHLQVLVDRIDEWEVKMENIIRVVENGTEELVRDNFREWNVNTRLSSFAYFKSLAFKYYTYPFT